MPRQWKATPAGRATAKASPMCAGPTRAWAKSAPSPHRAARRAVTKAPGHYARPRFSPDGKTIVFEKREGGYLVSPRAPTSRASTASRRPAVKRCGSATGRAPHFGSSNDRMFFESAPTSPLVSINLDGEAKRTHAEGELTTDCMKSRPTAPISPSAKITRPLPCR